MSRCTGHCCRSFILTVAPEEVPGIADRVEDGAIIADMVIPLGPRPDGIGYNYTCRHLADGSCAIYEDRPRMCRNYPYGKRCVERGCTLDQTGVPASPWSYTSDPDPDGQGPTTPLSTT